MIFAKTSTILWGIYPLCGMKGYRLSKLKSAKSFCSILDWYELFVQASRSGWKIQQVEFARANEMVGQDLAGLYANWLILQAMIMGIF